VGDIEASGGIAAEEKEISSLLKVKDLSIRTCALKPLWAFSYRVQKPSKAS
jgi:hypothetical protein